MAKNVFLRLLVAVFEAIRSFLRAIYTSPRIRHASSGLDLCYVEPRLIALSRPASTFPHNLYCNPVPHFLKFLHTHHPASTTNVLIVNLRAEEPGYHDHEFRAELQHHLTPHSHNYDPETPASLEHIQVHHAPWPDHHPPPFRVLLATLDTMYTFLNPRPLAPPPSPISMPPGPPPNRLIAVHCKAGKGRTGTLITSYLIAHTPHTLSSALSRFTEVRMRPGMGDGVSIGSQLRYVQYVSRLFRSETPEEEAKDPFATPRLPLRYVDRRVRVREIRLWGLKLGPAGSAEITVGGYVCDESDERRPWRIRDYWRGDAAEKKELLVLRPQNEVILGTSDILLAVRFRAFRGCMTTAKVRVWFNAFFELGEGEDVGMKRERLVRGEDGGERGVFGFTWEDMDGVKGTSWRGVGRRGFVRGEVEFEVLDSEEQDEAELLDGATGEESDGATEVEEEEEGGM